MSQRSVSNVNLLLEINDGQTIKCQLKRHLSPKAVGQIIRSLPFHANAHFLGKSAVYFETSVDSGIERSKKEFKKGDIAFLPVGKLICFFYSDVKLGKAMTPIGKIIDGVDKLSTIVSGNNLKFYYGTET